MKKTLQGIFSLLLFTLSVVCLFILIQTNHIWGNVYIEQILINLTDDISSVSNKFLTGYAISAVLGVISAIAFSLVIKKNRYLVLISCCCFVFIFEQIGIFSHLFHLKQVSEIYEKEYTFPKNLNYTFLTPKRNLIVIYLESIEENYATSPYLNENLIPNIFAHMKTGLSFDGFHQIKRQDYTVAAMVQSMCAVPYKNSILKGSVGYQNFLENLDCYPEILAQNGYNTVFMKGANINFARTGLFLRSHGFQTVMGKEELEEKFPYPFKENAGTFSGYRDSSFYEMVKLELSELSRSKEPFALFFITLDTHTPDYYLDPNCSGTPKKQEDVVRCADTMFSNFLQWLQSQNFYTNTTVVVLGDHVETGNNTLYPKEKDRKIVNFILNPSPVFEKKPHTSFTTLDIAPTVLNALGIYFNGGRFGLGRSLLQEEPTLFEKMGLKLETELEKSSKIYDGFETIKTKSEPKYNLYAPLGLTLSTPEQISHFATFSNVLLGVAFLDELSFTFPKTERQSLKLNLKFKTMLSFNNKREINILANNKLIERITVTEKDVQPISKTITVSGSFLQENKLLLQFQDLNTSLSSSLTLGITELSVTP